MGESQWFKELEAPAIIHRTGLKDLWRVAQWALHATANLKSQVQENRGMSTVGYIFATGKCKLQILIGNRQSLNSLFFGYLQELLQ